MFLVYVLLIIIAIGVLLASEAGQQFLALLINLGLIGVVLFLGLCGLVLLYLFVTWGWGKWNGLDAIDHESVTYFLWVMIFALIGIFISWKIDNKLKSNYGVEKIQKFYKSVGCFLKNVWFDFIAVMIIASSILVLNDFIKFPAAIVCYSLIYSILGYLVIKYGRLLILRMKKNQH